MLVTEFTKRTLRARREARDMLAAGWEYVGDSGGRLWELDRGVRWAHKIVDVKIASDGKGLWAKCEGPEPSLRIPGSAIHGVPVTHNER